MKPLHDIANVTKSAARNIRLSQERQAIEKCLQDAATGLTRGEIAERTNVASALVGPILQRLRHDGKAANTGNASATKWHIRRASTTRTEPERRYPTAIYTADELKPFSGRAGALDAFALPSRGIKA